MDNVNKAIIAAMDEFEKEHGEGAKLEDGEEFVTVFNDCVLIVGVENKKPQLKFIAGKPYKVDMTVGFMEESEESE